MAKQKSKPALIDHCDASINDLKNYLSLLINSNSDSDSQKADKLAYWISTWSEYLLREESFDPSRLRRYKRGEIIKANLGFNIGSEEGGLHYAVVIDNKNDLHDSTMRIIPLTSVKPGKEVGHLPRGCVFLGEEIYNILSLKISALVRSCRSQLDILKNAPPSTEREMAERMIEKLESDISLCEKVRKEIQKMKRGSIALVNQITTISKLRIYDPRTNHDVLSGVKLSSEKLDLLDNEIKNLFTSSRS